MPAKLSQAKVEAILKRDGVRLQPGQVYRNRKTSLTLVCGKGHIFDRTLDHYQSGHTCPECSGFRVTPTEDDPPIVISGILLTRSQWLAKIDRYSRTNARGCLIWHGTRNDKGYGIIQVGGKKNPKKLYVHRVRMAIQRNWDIPGNLLVTHRCDVPSCNSPFHLRLGTPSSNILEAVERDRMNYSIGDPKLRGELRYNARLTEDEVILIKKLLEMGISVKKLARRFEVSESCIRNIKSGDTWNHLQLPPDWFDVALARSNSSFSSSSS